MVGAERGVATHTTTELRDDEHGRLAVERRQQAGEEPEERPSRAWRGGRRVGPPGAECVSNPPRVALTARTPRPRLNTCRGPLEVGDEAVVGRGSRRTRRAGTDVTENSAAFRRTAPNSLPTSAEPAVVVTPHRGVAAVVPGTRRGGDPTELRLTATTFDCSPRICYGPTAVDAGAEHVVGLGVEPATHPAGRSVRTERTAGHPGGRGREVTAVVGGFADRREDGDVALQETLAQIGQRRVEPEAVPGGGGARRTDGERQPLVVVDAAVERAERVEAVVAAAEEDGQEQSPRCCPAVRRRRTRPAPRAAAFRRARLRRQRRGIGVGRG